MSLVWRFLRLISASVIVWFVYSSAVREYAGSDPADAVVVMSVFYHFYVTSQIEQWSVLSISFPNVWREFLSLAITAASFEVYPFHCNGCLGNDTLYNARNRPARLWREQHISSLLYFGSFSTLIIVVFVFSPSLSLSLFPQANTTSAIIVVPVFSPKCHLSTE